jgi:excisionase family DNA binding protein
MEAHRIGGGSPEHRLAYRPTELAALVGLSAKAVYRAIERGELRAARVANGSRLLITTEATESWLRAATPEPGPALTTTPHARRPRRRPLADALSESGQLRLSTDDRG